MGGCAATDKNVKIWSVILVIDAALFIGAAVYSMLSMKDLKDNISCILDDYTTLTTSLTTSSMDAGAEAASLLNVDNLETVQKSIDYLDYGAMVPGILMAVFLLVSLLTALCGTKKDCCRVTSKCFVTFGLILNVVAFVFFAILIVLGIASQTDQAKTDYATAVSSCTEGAVEINQQLAEAAASLALAEALGGDVTQEQADYNEAKFQADTYASMCTCVDNSLSTLEPLDGPGILGVISCIVGFIALIGACCAQACCKPPAPKVQPS